MCGELGLFPLTMAAMKIEEYGMLKFKERLSREPRDALHVLGSAVGLCTDMATTNLNSWWKLISHQITLLDSTNKDARQLVNYYQNKYVERYM